MTRFLKIYAEQSKGWKERKKSGEAGEDIVGYQRSSEGGETVRADRD